MEQKEIEKKVLQIVTAYHNEPIAQGRITDDVVELIQQLLTEAYNEGVTDAAGKARVIGMPCGDIRTCGCMGSCERPDWNIDKQSILSLLKK